MGDCPVLHLDDWCPQPCGHPLGTGTPVAERSVLNVEDPVENSPRDDEAPGSDPQGGGSRALRRRGDQAWTSPRQAPSSTPRVSMNSLKFWRSFLTARSSKPSTSLIFSTTPSGFQSSCTVTRELVSVSLWKVTTPACSSLP